jgi:hypothetical protein
MEGEQPAQKAVPFRDGVKGREADVGSMAAEIAAILDDGPNKRIPALPDLLGLLLH